MAAHCEAAIDRARQAGVSGFLLAGVELSGWRVEVELAARHKELFFAFGVHPQMVPLLDDNALKEQLDALAQTMSQTPPQGLCRPHAIGEIGLDSHVAAKDTLPRQERVFREQLALARAQNLPIVLHILHTHGEALRVLKSDGVPRAGGVVHSYSGSAELVKNYLLLGLHISFSGAVANPSASKLRKAACAVPLERLLVETDAPFQTPMPRRPAENEPAFLGDVLDALAIIRKESRPTLERATDENARRLLKL